MLRGSMAQLHRIESNDPQIGGFRVCFPSGTTKNVLWRSANIITPTLEAAKDYAAKLVQTMLDEKRIDDLDRTNIPSLVAAIQKIISDWNATIPHVQARH